MRQKSRKISKSIIAILLAFALAMPIAMTPIDSQAAYGRWQYDASGWRFYDFSEGYVTGIWKIDGTWYYFDNYTAYMRTGWIEFTDGYWRYFHADGSMALGWQFINGTWYYFSSSKDGGMLTGWWTISGKDYYFADSGAMHTGWLEMDGIWYYYHSSGMEATGWQRIGGVWYYFEPKYDNEMVTGLHKIDDTYYYFMPSGAMTTGWQLIEDSWYYFASNGSMVANQWIGNYYLLGNGKMATNQWVGNYYVGTDGVWIPGYSGPSNPTEPTYKTGWVEIDGETYYYDEYGYKVTDWQVIDGSWYYFYYDGSMARDTWIFGEYYVGTDGVWIPGYVNTDENLDLLKTYILNNGFTNDDGNKVINFEDTSSNGTEYITGIVYDDYADELTFSIVAESSSSTSLMTMIACGSITGQNLAPRYIFVYNDSSTFCEATATINANTYYEGCEVDFNVVDSNGLSDSSIHELANTFLKVAFSGWEVLVNDAGLTLNDIGFTAY